MRKTSAVCALLLVAHFLSCQKADNSSPTKVVCLLFDFSESTNYQKTRKIYSDNFRAILSKINPGDEVAAATITEISVAEPELIVKSAFEVFRPTSDNLFIKKAEQDDFDNKVKATKDSLCSVVDSVLINSARKIMRTDIMSSLHVADRIFKSSHRPKKVLVIMSDMIEDSESYNFEKDDLSSQRIAQIIESEKQKKRAPDLAGVKVYAIGASAKSKEKFFRIRDFWLNYFQACGGDLANENYGATLVGFEE